MVRVYSTAAPGPAWLLWWRWYGVCFIALCTPIMEGTPTRRRCGGFPTAWFLCRLPEEGFSCVRYIFSGGIKG
jgi:hypothetical protein